MRPAADVPPHKKVRHAHLVSSDNPEAMFLREKYRLHSSDRQWLHWDMVLEKAC